MNRANGVALTALGLVVLGCVVASRLVLPPGAFGDLDTAATWRYSGCALAAGLAYLGAVALLRNRTMPGWTLGAGLAIAVAARLIMLGGPPVLSTDLYRYVWDGRVQAAGINPYRYMPADPALAPLRDGARGAVAGAEAIYPNINRAGIARTIYPPAAQALFALIGVTWPSIWGVKTAMLLLDGVAGIAAWGLLRRSELPRLQILLWAWNPLVIWEFAGAGHIDAAAAAASGLALLLAAERRPAAAGAALAFAVLFKLLPAALAPAIWRPRSWQAPVAGLLVVAAGYACYASAGANVLGYLGGYAQEEQLSAGGGFLLLRLAGLLHALPSWAGPAYMLAALLLLAGLALVILRRPGPPRADVIAGDALVLSAALLAVLSPHYPWYLTMLVLPATVVPRYPPLWATASAPLLYQDFSRGAVLWPAMVLLPVIVWLVFEMRKGLGHA